MNSKTRKRIWPMSLMVSIGIVGVLAMFFVMAANPATTQAHNPGEGETHEQLCTDMTPDGQMDHDAAARDIDGAPLCDDTSSGGSGGTGGTGGTGGAGSMYASMPMYFGTEALDNGARLSWEAPDDVPDGTLVGYQFQRTVYLQDSNNPLLANHGTVMMEVGNVVSYRDLGLSYGATYTYMVRAIVEMDDGTMKYGAWSDPETVIVASSGGRLEALLDPPTMATLADVRAACDDSVTVTWAAPDDFGTAPATDGNGMYVGPDYIGGTGAGLEEVGQNATIRSYEIERRYYDTATGSPGAWMPAGTVAANAFVYVDRTVAYENTYEYQVRPVNSAGLKGPWAMVEIDLEAPPVPLRPTSLRVNLEESQQQFELQWNAPVDTIGLWRTGADFANGMAAGNYESRRLTYVIQRQVGTGAWEELDRQPHQYSRDGLGTVLTQEFIDDDFAGLAGNVVRYRVRALVDTCNPSDWNQADEVEVLAPVSMDFVGSVAATSAAGAISISWSPAAHATSQVLIAVNTADDADFCLQPLSSGASSYTCSGLTVGGSYVVLVIALHPGGYTLGNVVPLVVN